MTITDPRAALAEMQARADAATEGPWRATSYGVEVVPEFDLHRFDIIAETVARTDLRHEDSEFIATVRTDAPLAYGALIAALDEHQPVKHYPQAGDAAGVECLGCTTPSTWAAYPCPTVTAVTDALGGDRG